MIKLYYTLCLLLMSIGLSAQAQLKMYKELFLQEQVSLRKAKLEVDFSTLEYKKVKKDRYPSLTLESYYRLQHGGRDFEIPTGTLLNPVYNNLTHLNTVTDPPEGNAGFPDKYGTVDNSTINFLREKEYDANLTMLIPLLNFSTRASIQHKKMENDLAKLKYQKVELAEWSTFKINYFTYFRQKELTKLLDIKKKTIQAFQASLENQKESHKTIASTLTKIELDEFEVDLKIKEGQGSLENNRVQLLTMLGMDHNEELKLDPVDLSVYQFEFSKEEVFQIWKEQSATIQLINQRSDLLKNQLLLSKEAYKPSVSLLLRSGLQGEEFNTTEKPLYLIGALQMKWNLFNPKNKIEQKQIEVVAQQRAIETKTMEQQINFQLQELYDAITLGKMRLTFLTKKIDYSEVKLFEIQRKQEFGKATKLEVYNAALMKESIEVEFVQAKFDYLILICELEKLIGVELFK